MASIISVSKISARTELNRHFSHIINLQAACEKQWFAAAKCLPVSRNLVFIWSGNLNPPVVHLSFSLCRWSNPPAHGTQSWRNALASIAHHSRKKSSVQIHHFISYTSWLPMSLCIYNSRIPTGQTQNLQFHLLRGTSPIGGMHPYSLDFAVVHGVSAKCTRAGWSFGGRRRGRSFETEDESWRTNFDMEHDGCSHQGYCDGETMCLLRNGNDDDICGHWTTAEITRFVGLEVFEYQDLFTILAILLIIQDQQFDIPNPGKALSRGCFCWIQPARCQKSPGPPRAISNIFWPGPNETLLRIKIISCIYGIGYWRDCWAIK